MKKSFLRQALGFLLLACLCALYYISANTDQGSQSPSADSAIALLFDEKASGVAVEGSGTVDRLLSDDNEGGRHQRFILRLSSGQTLLIAHNIDIAPRLDGLRVGDSVAFCGEYVYTEEGGTVHWTHHDPDGSHADGWLEWEGKAYQ